MVIVLRKGGAYCRGLLLRLVTPYVRIAPGLPDARALLRRSVELAPRTRGDATSFGAKPQRKPTRLTGCGSPAVCLQPAETTG